MYGLKSLNSFPTKSSSYTHGGGLPANTREHSGILRRRYTCRRSTSLSHQSEIQRPMSTKGRKRRTVVARGSLNSNQQPPRGCCLDVYRFRLHTLQRCEQPDSKCQQMPQARISLSGSRAEARRRITRGRKKVIRPRNIYRHVYVAEENVQTCLKEVDTRWQIALSAARNRTARYRKKKNEK